MARWAFPKLVNAGRYDAARRVAQSGALTEPAAGQPLAEQDRDVVFCLAVLGLQPPDDEAQELAQVTAVGELAEELKRSLPEDA